MGQEPCLLRAERLTVPIGLERCYHSSVLTFSAAPSTSPRGMNRTVSDLAPAFSKQPPMGRVLDFGLNERGAPQ